MGLIGQGGACCRPCGLGVISMQQLARYRLLDLRYPHLVLTSADGR